ncbi:MAG: tRNA pseudouridine(38-40) synthase TruA [Bacteroidia bacterium]|nr:tRNA pseudouridine(38-40) synthase TruA [Bacteroidia bacterium]MCZ2277176.1 tRNA pseudouridine(38-40) synthase TruA [Bacteroidia bacterium]
MPRYFLEISFKGTRFNGWQIQTNATGVQQIINQALTTLTGKEVTTLGCCRTDTGVHALQYFLHFDSDETFSDRQLFVFNLNGILPEDIAVYDVYTVDKNSNARFDACKRTYRYYGYQNKNPFLKNYAGAFFFDLDVEKINECCLSLLKFADFSSFAKRTADQDNFICDIYSADWKYSNGLHCFEISANRFLRGMVRAITGTLIRAGKGLISVEEFCQIIRKKDRRLAGAAVQPQGLYLMKIEYPFLKVERKAYFPFEIIMT